ncbi:MAG: radical SAM family heme chaperone HemW [Rickettsiales bacterium]|jgi:oxygen-independent coproporphyrinogen-3 oxidase|nr:radical SAM family heme chaperone HemW [Rickettsiales bacterium]
MSEQDISVYVHYPLCLAKCPYCDFSSRKISNDLDNKRLEKCYLGELQYYLGILKGRKIKTVFFGGGTPSLMPLELISKILDCCSITKNTEVSIEVNPSSSNINKFKDYKLLGINRISIGVQSLNNEYLKFFGRLHDRKDAILTIENAQKVFKDRYSIDLIYARPEQNLKEWLKELEEASNLSPFHLSLYQLVVSKGTKFFIDGVKALDDDEAGIMYNKTNEFLETKNIKMYEVSNYAKDGFQCRHNINYWNSGEWIGIGAGASGRFCHNDLNCDTTYRTRVAVENYKSVEKWIEHVEKQQHGAEFIEKLSRDEFREEVILLGLRMSDGINIDNVRKYLKVDDFYDLIFDRTNFYLLQKKKYIEVLNNNFRVNAYHFNVLDSIIRKLL